MTVLQENVKKYTGLCANKSAHTETVAKFVCFGICSSFTSPRPSTYRFYLESRVAVIVVFVCFPSARTKQLRQLAHPVTQGAVQLRD